MELQDGKMERKRFIICFLSFFYSSDVSVYYSLKFIFVIVWAAKIGNICGKGAEKVIFIQSDNPCIEILLYLHLLFVICSLHIIECVRIVHILNP